jgi:hypothetical protein
MSRWEIVHHNAHTTFFVQNSDESQWTKAWNRPYFVTHAHTHTHQWLSFILHCIKLVCLSFEVSNKREQ